MDELEAVIGVVITVLVLIVVAEVITIVIKVAEAAYYIHESGGGQQQTPSTNTEAFLQVQVVEQITSGEIYPNYGPFYSNGSDDEVESPLPSGFMIQYGVDGNTNLWIATGYQTVNQDLYGYATTNENNYGTLSTNGVNVPTNYTFALTLNGIGNVTYTADSTNADDSELDEHTNNSGAETNADGDVITYANSTFPISTNCVIVMRSTNLMTWQSIYTDYVNPGAVHFYTDTQIFLPTFITYYNYNTNGGDTNGGGDLPPGGDTNGIGTNGVLTIPGQAFYRLAYPSNQADYFSP